MILKAPKRNLRVMFYFSVQHVHLAIKPTILLQGHVSGGGTCDKLTDTGRRRI